MKKTLTKWLTLAKEKLHQSFLYIVLGCFALAEAAMAIIEFVLHVLRIPHWH
jgi:hypothetical protein